MALNWGYYSRLRLFKLVLLNIAFAGASELVREVGMDWMSQDLAARLSTRAAQGIGAGLLTARLGIKASGVSAARCRGLTMTNLASGIFRRQLIGQVKETLQKRQNAQRKIMQYRVLTGYLYAEVPVFPSLCQ